MSKRKVMKKTMPKKNDKIDAVPINLDYEMCDAGATMLAAAIIEQAARDYKYLVKNGYKTMTIDGRKNSGSWIREDKESFRKFFTSEWFEILTIISKVHCDGEKVIELIESGENDKTPKHQLVPSRSAAEEGYKKWKQKKK